MNRKLIVLAAVAGATVMGALGGSSLNAVSTLAQDTGSIAQTATPAPAPTKDPSMATHIGGDGTREELLTGDTAEKVKAAALAAVPGGTIQRVETDAEGSPYEAHMTKPDGTRVTVKVDANFNVTSTEDGGKRKSV